MIKNDNPALQPFIERLHAIKAANSETELYDRKFNVKTVLCHNKAESDTAGCLTDLASHLRTLLQLPWLPNHPRV